MGRATDLLPARLPSKLMQLTRSTAVFDLTKAQLLFFALYRGARSAEELKQLQSVHSRYNGTDLPL